MSKPLTIEQELEAARAESQRLETELATANTQISTLQTAAQTHATSLADVQSQLAKATGDLATATTERDTLKGRVTELETAEQDLEKRASAKALAIAAGQGVPLIQAPANPSPTDPANPAATGDNVETLLAEYRTLQAKDSVAAGKFYAEKVVPAFNKRN
jgi:peptidoglycan hydrolase CwlO-like protein